MRKRQTLTLIELAIMLLVFTAAAAICLRIFLWADQRSREIACRDDAIIEMQNAAEVLQATAGDFSAAAAILGGNWDGAQWILDYGTYQLRVQPVTTDIPGLGSARIEALYEAQTLVSMTLHWQEVAHEP